MEVIIYNIIYQQLLEVNPLMYRKVSSITLCIRHSIVPETSVMDTGKDLEVVGTISVDTRPGSKIQSLLLRVCTLEEPIWFSS